MNSVSLCKIITIDGPAASGKGSVARKLAKILNYHYLESGLIYRAVAILILQHFIDRKLNVETLAKIAHKINVSSPELALPKVNDDNIQEVIILIRNAKLQFIDQCIQINGKDASILIGQETIGLIASFYSRIPELRKELVELQRSFAVSPGLVTDGRDMGSMIFPEADLKVFLTASVQIRAKRAYDRYCQLHHQVDSSKLTDILQQLKIRDEQDTSRDYAKLQYDDSYLLVDNTNMDIQETLQIIMNNYPLKGNYLNNLT